MRLRWDLVCGLVLGLLGVGLLAFGHEQEPRINVAESGALSAECFDTPVDAGVPDSGAPTPDAGTAPDAGFPVDAGTPDAGDFAWTEFPPQSGGTTFFVDPVAGSDSYDGLRPKPVSGTNQGPCGTVEACLSRMTDLTDDRLLLRRGRRHSGPISLRWELRGRNSEQPMIVSAYGEPTASDPTGVENVVEARPELRTAERCLLANYNRTPGNVWFISLDCHHVGRDWLDNDYNPAQAQSNALTDVGIEWKFPPGGEGVLFEDVRLRGYARGIVAHTKNGNTFRYFHVRASSLGPLYDGRNGGTNGNHTTGIFLFDSAHTVMDHVVFWRVGAARMQTYDPHGTVPAGLSDWDAAGNYSDHTTYFGIEVDESTGCISYYSGSWQYRHGGKVQECLAVGLPDGVLFGGGSQPKQSGVTGHVRDCVFVDAGDYPPEAYHAPNLARGVGIRTSNIVDAVFERNLFMDVRGSAPRPVDVSNNCYGAPGNDCPNDVQNLRLRHNVAAGWGDGPNISGGTQVFQSGNDWKAPAVTQRTLDGYAQSLGLANEHELMLCARNNRKGAWNSNCTAEKINNYLRGE